MAPEYQFQSYTRSATSQTQIQPILLYCIQNPYAGAIPRHSAATRLDLELQTHGIWGGYNGTYSPALHLLLRVPEQTTVSTLAASSTPAPYNYRVEESAKVDEDARVDDVFRHPIAIGLPKQMRVTSSTSAPKAAEVGKIQLAEVLENRYDYTLPGIC